MTTLSKKTSDLDLDLDSKDVEFTVTFDTLCQRNSWA